MSYIPISFEDEQAMLKTIGAARMEDLFVDVPPSVILKNGLNLPSQMSEIELKRYFRSIEKNNVVVSDQPCFLGAGYYYHEVPAVVKSVVTRPEFLTSYTPYQPEIAQGTLQVLFDFQSYMVELTGLEVSNASLYDGATAVAEAVLLGLRVQKTQTVLLSRAIHPEYRQTIKTYLSPREIPCLEIPLEGVQTHLEFLKQNLVPQSVVVIQFPNFFGEIEDLKAISELVKSKDGFLIVAVAEAMHLGLFPSMGSLNVDVCAGSAQSFGNPLSFGGPHAGFLTTKLEFVRQVPGRIVGETMDHRGNPGLVLTFQAREQHIRREKAVSNVCTTQSLMANFASAWLYLKGGKNVQEIALSGIKNAHFLVKELKKDPTFSILSSAYTNEFVLKTSKKGLTSFLSQWGLIAPYDLSSDYPEMEQCVLVSTTEVTSLEDLKTFLAACSEFSGNALAAPALDQIGEIPSWVIRRSTPNFPEHSEIELVRYYSRLAKTNFCIDEGFYPLGSCTMKYNPKINEEIALQDAWTNLHPLQREEEVQGALQVMYELEQWLKEITGCLAFTLQPAAGAHGEWTALSMAKKYFQDHGESNRVQVLVPDSSHGTNPASATMVGWQCVSIPTNTRGNLNLEALKSKLGKNTAVLMLTNPNTLGLFEEQILEISKLVHDAGGLLYYDGANMNAILGICRPADMGFDLVHLNLHKTFSTPHGGGGPGSGPVGASLKLEPYLPNPRVMKEGNRYFLKYHDSTIGRVKGNVGNFGVLLRALVYCKRNGKSGLEKIGRIATLNANYLKTLLKDHYPVAFDRECKHEFVLTMESIKKKFNISALDIAKRLIDLHYHPPTIYFPLIVPEAMMIEPTETETKQTLDEFAKAMIQIRQEIETDPQKLKQAPISSIVGRLDEVLAIKEPRLIRKWS
jgi:glycine dehydrogenase subunit 2